MKKIIIAISLALLALKSFCSTLPIVASPWTTTNNAAAALAALGGQPLGGGGSAAPSWTNNGVVWSFDTQGRFVGTNTLTGAYSEFRTNGHSLFVDQYRTRWERWTNFTSITYTNGHSLVYSNFILNLDGNLVLTNGSPTLLTNNYVKAVNFLNGIYENGGFQGITELGLGGINDQGGGGIRGSGGVYDISMNGINENGSGNISIGGSGGFTGNGIGIVNLNGTNIVGGLTNNTTGNAGTATTANNATNLGGLPAANYITTNNVFSLYNDAYINASYNNLLPPLASVETVGSMPNYPAYIPSYHNGDWYFNESGGLAYFNFQMFPVPPASTNVTISFQARSLTGGNTSAIIGVWNNNIVTIANSNFVFGVVESNYSITASTVNGTNTGLGILWGNATTCQMAISNVQMTFLPSLNDAVLSGNYISYQVSQKNLEGQSGNINPKRGGFASYPMLDYSTSGSSGRTICNFKTDAKNLDLVLRNQYNNDGNGISVYIDGGTPGLQYYQPIYYNSVTNFFQIFSITLPTNKLIYTVSVINGYNALGAGVVALDKIIVPSTNTVVFSTDNAFQKKIWVFGDSIISGVNQLTDMRNDTLHLIEGAYPWKFYQFNSSGGQLYQYWTETNNGLATSVQTIDSFIIAQPDVALIQIGYNDWNVKSYGTTNAFEAAYANMLDTLHANNPACRFYCLAPFYTTSTSSDTNSLQDYRNMIQLACSTRLFTCYYGASSNWNNGSGQLLDGVHPTSAANALDATYISALLLSTNFQSGGIYSGNIVVKTNWTSNVLWTNNTGLKVTVYSDENTTSAASGVTGFQLLYDPSGANNWQTNCDGSSTEVSLSIAGMVNHQRLSGPCVAGGVIVFTNISTVGTASLQNGYYTIP